MARQDQNNAGCHHRSSATVHVDPNGNLELLCTERSVANMNPSGTLNFKLGTR